VSISASTPRIFISPSFLKRDLHGPNHRIFSIADNEGHCNLQE
jgi:hypothetical protein